MSGGVTVLGGYPSTGGAERNVQENETILDGAINDTDTVYTIAYGLLGEQDIVVDGFIFRHATGRCRDLITIIWVIFLAVPGR